jgi:hypothetical protein
MHLVTAEEKVKAIELIMLCHQENRDSETGDRHLSDLEYAYEAMDEVIFGNTDNQARRDGFIDKDYTYEP